MGHVGCKSSWPAALKPQAADSSVGRERIHTLAGPDGSPPEAANDSASIHSLDGRPTFAQAPRYARSSGQPRALTNVPSTTHSERHGTPTARKATVSRRDAGLKCMEYGTCGAGPQLMAPFPTVTKCSNFADLYSAARTNVRVQLSKDKGRARSNRRERTASWGRRLHPAQIQASDRSRALPANEIAARSLDMLGAVTEASEAYMDPLQSTPAYRNCRRIGCASCAFSA